MELEMPNTSGAQFVRADLHIHSYGEGGSFDVTDTNMNPENIVDTAIEKGLKIISITDHNEIENVRTAIGHSEGKDILVVPGIEVSTTQGHLLCYFKTYQNLRDFHGTLSIASNKETCNQGIVECLDSVQLNDGFGVLAHIELSSGFEQTIGRFAPPIENILCHPNLLGLEISSKESVQFYTDKDNSPDRKRLIGLRRERLDLPSDHTLAKVMSSDSHKLDKLGTNAENANRLTRIKADTLNFQAFKNALISHKSRIRIEDLIPEQLPKFLSVRVEGGLFETQEIPLSSNLTCIIGGRGAGKSTLLNAVKETTGNGSEEDVVDSEVWPDKIVIKYEDDAGQVLTFSREKHLTHVNETDPEEGILKIPIESYGQGDTAGILRNSDEKPEVLLDLLDKFIDVEILKKESKEVRELLIENRSKLVELRIEVAAIPDTERHLKSLEGKLEHLEKEDASDLVKFHKALHKEREIRDRIIADLGSLIETYNNILSDRSVFDQFAELKDDEIEVGKDYFKTVQKIVADFSEIVETTSGELKESLKVKVEELRVQLKNWKNEESEYQRKVDEKKAELLEKGIPFDLVAINQIVKDVTNYQGRLRGLYEKRTRLTQITKDRENLLKRRNELKEKIYLFRNVFAKGVNDNLKNDVDGLFVNVNYSKGTLSNEFIEKVKYDMDYRSAAVPKAVILAENLSPLEFAEALKSHDLSALKGITDLDGSVVFSDSEMERILRKLSEDYKYEEYETLQFEDYPTINVTRIIDTPKGKERKTRRISKLSLGQQQSILLAILLQSKSKSPLIIDQPEDNLDSEFIYKTIVANLRRIKEKRQVIIVTHNPNIAVLGDAELIIPLKSASEKSHILDRGSIDDSNTRDQCCEILEGGKRAFTVRKKIYGLD